MPTPIDQLAVNSKKMLKRIIKRIKTIQKNSKDDILDRFPFINSNDRCRLHSIAVKLLEKSGGEVFHGPLSGLKIPLKSHMATQPMFIVGCYEQEIHSILSEVICAPPKQMIDIGSAHGYYMVGMALQMQNTKVIGYEAEENVHWQEAADLARLNGVEDQVIQKGLCTCEDLQKVAKKGDFVLSDCEGGEIELLDPLKVPALLDCHILCEVHDFIVPRITARLIERFKFSHSIRLLHEEPRNPQQFRILDGFSEIDQLISVRETKHIGERWTPARFLSLQPKL
jgi:hypothetical protein